MNNSNIDINEVTQTARIQKPVKKTSVKAVPVIPVSGKPSVVKPTPARVAAPILKKPRTDTVKLKVVKKNIPAPSNSLIKKTDPVIDLAPVIPNKGPKTTKLEKPVIPTKTVKLSNPVKKVAPKQPTESVKLRAAIVPAPVAKNPVTTQPVTRKPVASVAPKKKPALKKEEIKFDVSDFEDDNVEPSILFMLLNLASAAMFVAGLSIALIK